MQQTHAWDLDLPIPSILMAVESNLRIPLPFLYLAMAPILLSFVLTFWISQPFPSFASFTIVSVICYLLANGFVIILILISQSIFYAAAVVHIFIKTRLVGSLNHSLFTIDDLKIDWLVCILGQSVLNSNLKSSTRHQNGGNIVWLFKRLFITV